MCTTITNSSNSQYVVKLGLISNDSIWFTHWNKAYETQRNCGFDIMYTINKIDTLKISPNSSVVLSCVVLPTKMCLDFPKTYSIPVLEYTETEYSDSDSVDISEDDQNPLQTYEIDFSITMILSAIQYKVIPHIMFVDDCRKDETKVITITLKNKCNLKLPIMLHSSDIIQIKTPKLPNFVELGPQEKINLTLLYTPAEIGQFVHKIDFDCILSTGKPYSFNLMTSVSPAELPPRFPTINVHALEFGEIHAGKPVCKPFTIVNNSEDLYTIYIAGVINPFMSAPFANETNGGSSSTFIASSMSTINSSLILSEASSSFVGDIQRTNSNSTPELMFKTSTTAIYEAKPRIELQPFSSLSIFTQYTPSFNLSVSSEEFDRRNFVIALKFVRNNDLYYRRLRCKASVCISQIVVSPETINFGDTTLDKTIKQANVTISNLSPLETTVSISTPAHSVVLAPTQVLIPAQSSVQYPISFYPKKINPDYTANVTFVNENNLNNEINIGVSATVVAAASQSLHQMNYSIVNDTQAITYLNFNNVPCYFPSICSFSLKNRTQGTLTISISSSSPEELMLFTDENSMSISLSSSLILNASASSFTSQTDAILSTLLTSSTPLLSMRQLEAMTKNNSNFFMNLFSMYGKYHADQLAEHFETQLSQIQQNIDTLTNVDGSEIEIPPSSRVDLIAILIPKAIDSVLWQHKELSFSIDLLNEPDSKPYHLPVIYNCAMSNLFLSAHTMNFGTLQCNTQTQYKMYMVNDSAVPLLFRVRASSPVSFEKECGIIYPFSNVSVPFSIFPRIDGKLTETIFINNILNIEEEQEVYLKGRIKRRSNFFLDTLEINFGDIYIGMSSQPIQIFLTNTSTSENEFTFSHVRKDSLYIKPLITYQFKDMNTRLLSEKVQLQIEKLGCKLRCLQRKNKVEYAKRIQHIIDDLSRTNVPSNPTQLKQMDAKYMDRVVFKADPLQLHCIEVQLIPSTVSNKILMNSLDVDGIIIVYERGRVETQKMIKYHAKIIPETQPVIDSINNRSLEIEKKSFEFNDVFVHDCASCVIKLKNISNTVQNFWISSNSGNDAIVSSQMNEGQVKVNETLEIPIDIFCLLPGNILKTITVTTHTASQIISLNIHSIYKPVLSIKHDIIDFGCTQLTSLSVVEKRERFVIENTSYQELYLTIINPIPAALNIYEVDPKEPISNKSILLQAKSCIALNLIFIPDLDRELYHRYKTLIFDKDIIVSAYESEEEALNPNSAPLYKKSVKMIAKVGRIGLLISQLSIDFGTLGINSSKEQKLIVKNRSTHIPLEIISSTIDMTQQYLDIKPSQFTIEGHKEIELTVKLTPSGYGVTDGKIQLTAGQYVKIVNVVGFVDPKTIETGLPKDDKDTDVLRLGSLYFRNDVPIPKSVSINLKNLLLFPVTLTIPELNNKCISLKSKGTSTLNFDFPFTDTLDDMKFNQKLQFISKLSKRVVKIINIVGEYVISVGSLSSDSISLGRFGQFNQWSFNKTSCFITNQSNIGLTMNISSSSKELVLPKKIGPIAPFEIYELPIEPNIKALRDVEGQKTVSVTFLNIHNPANNLKLSVQLDIRKSFLLFNHLMKNENGFLVELHKFTQITDADTSIFSANNWFSITNCFENEINVFITVEQLMEGIVNIELFQRKSEVKINDIQMQANEIVEIRAKATLSNGKEIPPETVIAKVVFRNNMNSGPVSLSVINAPKTVE